MNFENVHSEESSPEKQEQEIVTAAKAAKIDPQDAELRSIGENFELTDANMEKIMDKLVDINEYGTAFTVVDTFNPDTLKEWADSEKERELRFKLTREQFRERAIEEKSEYNRVQDPKNVKRLREAYKECLNELKWYQDDISAGRPEYAEERWEKKIKIFGLSSPEIKKLSLEEFTEAYREGYIQQIKEWEPKIEVEYKEYLKESDKKIAHYYAVVERRNKNQLNRVKSIFREGILGGTSGGIGKHNSKEEWAKDVRTGSRRNVFFNIVGRFSPYSPARRSAKEPVSEMAKTMYFTDHFSANGEPTDAVAIIFDQKQMQESWRDNKQELVPGKRKFKSADIMGNDREPSSEHGFAGPVRVPPRLLKGIVFAATDTIMEKEELGERDSRSIKRTAYSKDPEKWNSRAKKLVEAEIEIDKEKPENLLPVYDVMGNLYWPKKMSYKEVQEAINENLRKKHGKDNEQAKN